MPAEPGAAPGGRDGAMRVYEAPTQALLASQHRDPLLRHLTKVIVAEATARRAALPNELALDIGCGVGRTSLALAAAGFKVIGLDPSARAVAVAQATARARGDVAGRVAFLPGDATDDPPPAWHGRFGLAVCSEVLEHVREPARVVDFARRALVPGGLLVVTVPHDRAQWTVMDDYAGHVTRFDEEELRALLWDFEVLALGTEGFPFQRAAMAGYDRLRRTGGGEHAFEDFGDSPAYAAYASVMPLLLRLDHALRGLRRGTTLVATARRRVIVA